jgi:hypothetical protein
MATPGELVEIMAEAAGFPAKTLVVHDRNLVVAGLRTKGGRGRSAPKVNARDAAHLLVAMLASREVRDSVAAVKRYSKAYPHPSSTNSRYASSGIAELTHLPAKHSFVDAVEALFKAVCSGGLADAVKLKTRHVAVPGLVQVGAMWPETLGDIRLAGLPDQSTIQIRYAAPTPWDGGRKPSDRDVAQWEARVAKELPRPDFKAFQYVSERTIYGIGHALAPENGDD